MPEDDRNFKQEYEQAGVEEPEGLAGEEQEKPTELEDVAGLAGGQGEQEEEEESGDEESVSAEDEQPAPATPQPARTPFPVMPAIEKGTEVIGEKVWGPQEPKPKNDMSDLFAVPQPEDNDMYIDDLFEVPEEDVDADMTDDLSDLTRVTKDDVMGRPPRQRLRRTRRPYNPPTSVGGVGT